MWPLALAGGVAGCTAPVPTRPAEPVPPLNVVRPDVRVEKDAVPVPHPGPAEVPDVVPAPAKASRLEVADYQGFLQVAAGAPRPETRAQLPTMDDLSRILPARLTPEQADKLLIAVPQAAIRDTVPDGMPEAAAPDGIQASRFRGGGRFGGGFGRFGGYGGYGGFGFRRFFPFAWGGYPFLAPYGLYGGLWGPYWPAFYPFGGGIWPFFGAGVPIPVPVPTTYGLGPLVPPVGGPIVPPFGGPLVPPVGGPIVPPVAGPLGGPLAGGPINGAVGLPNGQPNGMPYAQPGQMPYAQPGQMPYAQPPACPTPLSASSVC
ncbi:MAG: hypothetical protein FJZ01_15030 [Candidatus Sericytochromatia bacterium]|nr:hypothetical protein [Candidatus Tanganyikabacteria bacterium]